jgi:hypothetical protein
MGGKTCEDKLPEQTSTARDLGDSILLAEVNLPPVEIASGVPVILTWSENQQ